VVHVETVSNIEMWFVPSDALMREEFCGTEYDVMASSQNPKMK